jgi:hypothetical protein
LQFPKSQSCMVNKKVRIAEIGGSHMTLIITDYVSADKLEGCATKGRGLCLY